MKREVKKRCLVIGGGGFIGAHLLAAVMKEPATKRTVLGFKWSMLRIVLRHPMTFLKHLKHVRRFLFDLVTVW